MRLQYQIFIDEMIKHGDQTKAYKVAYPKATDATARVQSYRLVQNPTIAKVIKEQSDKIKDIATEKAIESAKKKIRGKILSSTRKREILHQIANGVLKIKVKKPVYNPKTKRFAFVSVVEIPDHSTRMKAIDLDNKMAGDYAPEKKDLTLKGSFLDFLMGSS